MKSAENYLHNFMKLWVGLLKSEGTDTFPI